MKELIDRLTKAAEEIRAEGHAGWGNTIDDAIAALEAAEAREAELRAEVSRLEREVERLRGMVPGLESKVPIGRVIHPQKELTQLENDRDEWDGDTGENARHAHVHLQDILLDGTSIWADLSVAAIARATSEFLYEYEAGA